MDAHWLLTGEGTMDRPMGESEAQKVLGVIARLMKATYDDPDVVDQVMQMFDDFDRAGADLPDADGDDPPP